MALWRGIAEVIHTPMLTVGVGRGGACHCTHKRYILLTWLVVDGIILAKAFYQQRREVRHDG
jgi:hypothetical protein